MGILRFLSSCLTVFVICLILGVWLWRVPLASRSLSWVFKTKVSVEVVDISLNFSKVTLKNLSIKNPAKSNSTDALTAETVEIKAPIYTYFMKGVNLSEIVLDRLSFNLDLYNHSGSDNNWVTLMERKESKELQHLPTSDETHLQVKKILIKDLSYHYSALHLSPIQMDRIAKVEILNLGYDQPITYSQLIALLERTFLCQFSAHSHYSVMRELATLPLALVKGTTYRTPSQNLPLKDLLSQNSPTSYPHKMSFTQKLFKWFWPTFSSKGLP